MTKLGVVANGNKETVLRTIDILNKIQGLRVIYITQNETSNLYIINETDYYKLKRRDAHQ
jgi:hypothetical protein